jgi:hypothetical protein
MCARLEAQEKIQHLSATLVTVSEELTLARSFIEEQQLINEDLQAQLEVESERCLKSEQRCEKLQTSFDRLRSRPLHSLCSVADRFCPSPHPFGASVCCCCCVGLDLSWSTTERRWTERWSLWMWLSRRYLHRRITSLRLSWVDQIEHRMVSLEGRLDGARERIGVLANLLQMKEVSLR